MNMYALAAAGVVLVAIVVVYIAVKKRYWVLVMQAIHIESYHPSGKQSPASHAGSGALLYALGGTLTPP